MNDMLNEVNVETFELSTLNGNMYEISPSDVTICCTWTPTSNIEIKKVKDQLYCFNLSNGEKVKITKI